ncbi:hypothetical protein PF002_g16816 [Phytophthora fragariae]|uniref:Uncharacterized protein n=1 Tax=Phytophthora fragariae TaxID=53985 RepID=A0A6A4CXZ2_9STRA|nr:hypothetical protein PF003_g11940 [Phytophthora fragariae]KAE8975457.1 hypothetical protein PF011_g24463 [Phytophthora fragariae]KAE9085247.1 hypothetical protein PF006_g26297 [Phytophthora fragariae]KAE9177419.1 hypothetical protein PF004_g25785 [Phytophthora fragariae]KAE9217370.1 hypothetical protein PF002_g16816 [Phytophthora fragariae]
MSFSSGIHRPSSFLLGSFLLPPCALINGTLALPSLLVVTVCSGATHSANLTLVQHALSGYIQVGHIAVWSSFILGSSPIGQKAGSFCQ